ncbi:MAG: Flp pilus assembly protein CpaB [Clostridiales bacterium]|nr:Flp pilus assembly protein CpaB [Clostridiales bacterium]
MKKIYLIALLFAVLTGVAVFNYAEYLQASSRREMESAVVAINRIPENTLITEDMVELRKLPVESINPLATNKLPLVLGKISNSAIEANEQVLTSRLIKKGADEGGLAYKIPDGKRAITMAVDDISGVAGNIKKSNHIDVIASIMMDQVKKDGTIEKVAKTILLLQNIEVLSINGANSDTSKLGYSNITLAVTPEEAAKLFYAETSGKVTAVLRPILETDVKSMAPYAP